MMREPDRAFADPRQAVLYDVFDHDRSDLDVYVAIAAEAGARRVIDVGCGTGSLASRLAAMGLDVVGVDPAEASLHVARTKPYAERVTWIHGDAGGLIDLGSSADLVVMTGNVAQVFVTDEDWHATLDAAHAALRPGGWLVFETRRPEVRAWEGWEISPTPVSLPDGRTAVVTRTVTDVALPLVTFESATTIDDEVLRSTSTLRFRERAEVERDLAEHGLVVMDVRDAPDRPGKEYVFLAQRPWSDPSRAVEHRRVLTERLELRAMEPADAEALYPIFSDPQMWWYEPGARHTRLEQTVAYATRAADRWATGLSYWTVRLRETGEVIGSGGVQRHEAASWNLNYRIATSAQGHGYAVELARAAIEAARSAAPEVPVIAWIDDHNTPSRRVAERVGLVDRGVHPTPNDGRPRLAYTLDSWTPPVADSSRSGNAR